MKMHSGIFVTFEGIDGSGKSSQLSAFVKMLERSGRKVTLVREPGGTKIGEKIRSLVLDKENYGMVPEAELLLYEAARSQIVSEIIRPALSDGQVVISDRYYDSSTAYQGYARGLPLEDVRFLNRFATGGLEPDITFLLDLPAEAAWERMGGRLDRKDRLEMEGLTFLETARRGYLEMAAAMPRFVVLDAAGPVDKIARDIERKFWEVIDR